MGTRVLVQHARDRRNDIAFTDYSLHVPFDQKWRTNCKERLSLTRGTIVLLGAKTWASEAVLWEIAETVRQSHYLFGIQINHDKTWRVPVGLPTANVIRWEMAKIIKWLDTWT